MLITTRSIVLLAPIVMAACAADWPALEGCDDGCTAPMSTSTTDETLPTTAGIQTVTGDATEGSTEVTGGAESTAGADNTGGANTLSTGETGAASETGGNEVILPEVVAIELPAEVHAAGPVPITVHTKNATSVLVKRDGVDVGELAGAGQNVFVGELAVKGAIDNGTRHVEVIATLDEHEDSDEASFEVKVPEAGKAAWTMPGPLGSRTNRIALTPEGDVIEAGLRIGAGIPRPSIHKRSGFDGSDLWPKKVLLSELEGHVADVAIAPDGGIWVAMNVKEVSQKWRPHILLLAPDGTPDRRRPPRRARPHLPRHRGRCRGRVLRRGLRGRRGWRPRCRVPGGRRGPSGHGRGRVGLSAPGYTPTQLRGCRHGRRHRRRRRLGGWTERREA
jgi:hypothetical protein